LNQWSCTCQTGFTGNTCQTVVSSCSPNPCLNGGQCSTNSLNQWSCTCQTGFTGNTCQTVVSSCSSNPCLNGGQCSTNSLNQWSCICQTGFTGNACQTIVAITTTTQITTVAKTCVDSNTVCPTVANQGFCRNDIFIGGLPVPIFCALSCNNTNLCGNIITSPTTTTTTTSTTSKSSTTTTTSTSTTTSTTPTLNPQCIDKNPNCAIFAKQGYCKEAYSIGGNYTLKKLEASSLHFFK
jgi:hypothetical protein